MNTSYCIVRYFIIIYIILAELPGVALKKNVIVQFFLDVTHCGSNAFLSVNYIVLKFIVIPPGVGRGLACNYAKKYIIMW